MPAAPDAVPLVPLPAPPATPLELLTRDAAPDELIQAAAENHVSWFTANAVVAGGDARHADGVARIYSPANDPSRPGEIILAFPRAEAAKAGDAIDATLDEARRRDVRQVGCWSLLPTEPPDLAARLAARGFQWGWEPHWMALDLAAPDAAFPLPDGLHIALDDVSEWDVADLPYYERAEAARLQAHARQTPRRTWHFGAWLDEKLVGHSLLHVSTGPRGVAGLYAVSVVPEARNRGVGRAVTLAACQYARALGCRYVLLNAATHIYDRMGFVSLGSGQTWWMFRPALDAAPPSPRLVAFAEAVGRGDLAVLDALATDDGLPADLDTPLLCKMTPLEVAARLGQPGAAEWLLRKGASPDVIPLCDLGWRDRLPGLLAARPGLADRRFGERSITPLHEAVYRDDADLVRLLLTANPDLTVEDTQFRGTPLGWARHLGRGEIARLIEAHGGTGTPRT